MTRSRLPARQGDVLSTALYAALREEIAEAVRWFAGVRVGGTDREEREWRFASAGTS